MKLKFRTINVIPEGETKPLKVILGIYCNGEEEYETVTEIEIPKGTYNISSDAFDKFINLKRVILPEGLKDFGSFGGLEHLEQIDIPNSVTSIEHDAFYNCRALTSLILPENLKHIGGCAFYDSGIKEITFTSIDKLYRVADNAFAGVRNIKYNLPEVATKPTVEYATEMGTPVLVDGYRERMAGKSLYEQAKCLTFAPDLQYNKLHKFHPYIEASVFMECDFIYAWARCRSFIVDDGVIVGYNVTGWKGNREITVPVLIGVPTCLTYSADYVHTGDNNGAGYLGDDDDDVYYTPLYTLVYEIGQEYPTTGAFDQRENYINEDE